MSSKFEQAFEKRTKNVFCLHFANSNFKVFFCTFSLISKKKMSYLKYLPNLCDEYAVLKIFMTFIKVVKNQIFKKVHLPLKPTWSSCFFLFHRQDPKQKQNHQISTLRANIRSTQSQTCVKYRGNIICIKRNTDVNTGDLKILHKKMSK